ncbi:MAG: PfkB family carbohydrate kinase [Acidimicrobiales bacterium]
MTPPRIGVVGSANVDLVARCEALPRPGETIMASSLARLPGGKGANQAAALAALGAEVSFVGCVGADESGDWLLAGLAARGVDVARAVRRDVPTGTALIAVDASGENVIIVAPGANDALTPESLDLAGLDLVLCQLEVPVAVVEAVVARAPRTVLNRAPARALSPETLAGCRAIVANEHETRSLPLAELAHVVVTHGAEGASRVERGTEVARAAPPRVTPVDTVGAGDVFCAAYALGLAEGWDLDETLRFAVAAGALATLAPGAQGSLPTRGEVEACLGAS